MSKHAAIFGDVHGRLDLLQILIARLREEYGNDLDLYSTGDLIDRGPDSRGVIDLCIRENVQAVLGNHESWLHMYLMSGQFNDFALHRIIGGRATLDSYGVTTHTIDAVERGLKARMPNAHMQFILDLPLWRKIQVGDEVFRLSHAGLKTSDVEALIRINPLLGMPEGADLLVDETRRHCHQSILWAGYNVNSPNLHDFADGSVQVFGHLPVWTPQVTRRWIAVDTGCGTRDPQRLSAVVLPERKVFTVDAASEKLKEKIKGPGFTDFTL